MRISDWSSDVCSSDLRLEDDADLVTVAPLVEAFEDRVIQRGVGHENRLFGRIESGLRQRRLAVLTPLYRRAVGTLHLLPCGTGGRQRRDGEHTVSINPPDPDPLPLTPTTLSNR